MKTEQEREPLNDNPVDFGAVVNRDRDSDRGRDRDRDRDGQNLIDRSPESEGSFEF